MPTSGYAATSTIAQGATAQPSVPTPAALAVREVFFTSADLQKPDRLYQVIHTLQQNCAKAFRVRWPPTPP